MNNDFCAFILSHGRPNNVKTYTTLLRHGYTGKIYIIIDNEDKTAKEYYKIFGDKVIIFDKLAISKTFDEADNFDNRKTIIYARNACFDIAEKLGIKYFIQLDDDYSDFRYKLNEKYEHINKREIKCLDKIFMSLLDYFLKIPALSIAIAQGGDFIGGKDGNAAKNPQFRKCMNSFMCSTDRKFVFTGRINEDVNTYCYLGSQGYLFLTIPNIALQQLTSQKNKGGMTDVYVNSGTYIKSFYTLMFCPSFVKIKLMITNHPRLHHSINWDNAVPCIIDEKHRKC